MPIDEFRQVNLANWDERVDGHITGYDVQRYIDDSEHLSDVVTFDRERLGDLTGQKVIHLQCHIGTDTLSLARLGADVTGIDFSPQAVAAASAMFEAAETPGRFVESELYDAPSVLDERFDMVYTGVGALTWLPDIDGWAGVVDRFLRPGGRLFITEGHPMAETLDQDREDRLLVIDLPYFEGRMNTWHDEDKSYLGDATLKNATIHDWNHGLGEIFTALLDRGFVIKTFVEHDSLFWQKHNWMELGEGGRYHFPEEVRDRVPLMYTLIADKEG